MPDYTQVFGTMPDRDTPGSLANGGGLAVPGDGVSANELQSQRANQLSKMNPAVLYAIFRDQFAMDSSHSAKWRTEARKEFDFVACRQWERTDQAELEDAGRVAITFNRTLAIIKSVAGIEINGRHEIAYLPRNATSTTSAEINEMLTEASNWMADGCDAEDEQSDAFQDCCICGMGWTEMRLEFEDDPEGKYIEERIDPLEMAWDSSARAKNLTDARRIWRVRKMLLSDARERFPGVPDVDLDAAWARRMGHMVDPAKPVEERLQRLENLSVDYDPKTEVHIVHVQWWERETYWRVIDPATPNMKPLEMTPQEFQRLKARYDVLERPIICLELKRRVYKQAFLGGAILGAVVPAPAGDRFTFQCITGERDRNEGIWFGLTRLMKDPQMWANKWLSQSLHILNSTAKGGILAEEDAFVDQREAEATYAMPDAITWVRKEAIQKGKIMQKPGGGIPTAYINLLQFAIGSIRDVVGINLELLGMRDANQPGILEAQRKQAAMTILATLFDSLRRYRKQVGRVRLFFIQNYLADGRWIRINGPDGRKFEQLIRDKTLGTYDVIIDDAPTSPNQKEKSWGIIQMMLPAIRDMLTPELIVMILEYSPLPAKLINSLKEMIKNPDPEKAQQAKLAQAMAEAELQKVASETARNQALAGQTTALTQKQMQLLPMELQKTMSEAMRNAAQARQATQPQEAQQQEQGPPQSLLNAKELAATHLTQAQTQKALADAAGVRAKTILDFAQVATTVQAGLLDRARTSYLEADAEDRGIFSKTENGEARLSGGLLDAFQPGAADEEFGMPDESMALPSLPMLPTMPERLSAARSELPPLEMGGGGGLLNLPRSIPNGPPGGVPGALPPQS